MNTTICSLFFVCCFDIIITIMEQKINYNLEMENLIKDFDGTQTLLLHSCCGPCSTAVITRLKDYFDITILYYNPCLHPNAEYDKRLHEQIKFIEELNKSLDRKIKIIAPPHDPQSFFDYVQKVKNYETEKEGGARCYACYEQRLEYTSKFANHKKFDYFGTTLSVSPYKHSDWLNKIGIALQTENGSKYLVSDFKKKDGYKLSITLSRKYDLYRQNYCGCIYSYNEMKAYEKNKNNI